MTEEKTINLTLLAAAVGRSHSDRKFRKGIDLLFSGRSGIQGSPYLSELGQAMALSTLLELIELGATDEFAATVATMQNPWVHRDRWRDEKNFRGPGFLVIRRNADRSPFVARYVSRLELENDPGRLLELATAPVMDPRGVKATLLALEHQVVDLEILQEAKTDARLGTTYSFVSLDLGLAAGEVAERLEAPLKDRDREPISAEQLVQAMVEASQVRDEIDSIVK